MTDKEAIEIQKMINSGLVWKLEGGFGIETTILLQEGKVMLGKKQTKDAYGNTIPSRNDLLKGSIGTKKFVEQKMGKKYADKLSKV